MEAFFALRTTDILHIMRAVFNAYLGRGMVILLLGSILSIAAVKYFSNDFANGVPMTTPAEAAVQE